MKTLLAALLFTVGACALDGDPEDTGETDQALVGLFDTGMFSCSNWIYGCSFDTGIPLQFGQTCVLSGIGGDLTFSQLDVGPNGTIPGTSHIVLNMRPSPGRTVKGGVTCVVGGGFTGSGTWNSSQGAASLGASGSTSECGLTSLHNTNGLSSSAEDIKVFRDTDRNRTWRLGGTVTGGHAITASAACWGTSFFWGGVPNYAPTWVSPSEYSPYRSGMGCTPVRFAGAFTNSSAYAWSFGNDQNLTWNLNVAYAGATTECAQ